MKYLKLYSDKTWMESVALKGKPGTIELTDEEFATSTTSLYASLTFLAIEAVQN